MFGPPRAVLFDLDDTLIDDSGGVEGGWRSAIGEFAPARGIDTEVLLATIYQVRDWYWSDAERHKAGRADLRKASLLIVAEALSRLGKRDDELAARISNGYRDIRAHSQTLMPGAVETLEDLRGGGVKLALLTNGAAEGQRAKLERFDLVRHFDYICIEGEFGYGKPDERVYRAALSSLASEPASTWMVGDNLEWDVAAPMRLGITGIWFDREGAGLPSGVTPTAREDGFKPDKTIRFLVELLYGTSL